MKKLSAYFQEKNQNQEEQDDDKSIGEESNNSELVTYIECINKAHNVFLN